MRAPRLIRGVGEARRRARSVKTAFWALCGSELVGTGLLVALGCSVVIADFGVGSPVAHWLPSAVARRVVTGFLFGTVGGAIALSRIGKVSGAHLNPVVTLAFWMRRTMAGRLALGYVAAQCVGAVLGAQALRLWGAMGDSVHWAVTVPGPSGTLAALLGETGATACLVGGLFLMLGQPRLRRFTPALFPLLYALLVGVEAPFSGTSTNPARTLGPSWVAGIWSGWWIYWIGPAFGTAIALTVLHVLAEPLHWEVEVAKLYHFTHDPHGLLRRTPPHPSPGPP